jgi:hypothetical protein
MNLAAEILAAERFARELPRESIVAPASPLMITAVQAMSATTMRGARCVAPRSGTLVDLHVYVGTASGTVRPAIYDTAATTRARLWTSAASVTVSGTGWVKLGDPNLAVHAGQAVDIALTADNAVLTIGRIGLAVAAAAASLPAAFASKEGGLPILGWSSNSATPPATLAESSLTASVVVPALIARVI